MAQFQSLTRDSNHSNKELEKHIARLHGFNPSRGIAIIQTLAFSPSCAARLKFQSLTRDSNHSNLADRPVAGYNLMFQSLTRDSNHSNIIKYDKTNN